MLSNSVSLLDCFTSLGLEGVTERINHSDEKAEYFSIAHTELLCQHYECPAWLFPHRPIALCPCAFLGSSRELQAIQSSKISCTIYAEYRF